jgi:hypothetical protein
MLVCGIGHWSRTHTIVNQAYLHLLPARRSHYQECRDANAELQLSGIEVDRLQARPFPSASLCATPILEATASDYLVMHLGANSLYFVSLETVRPKSSHRIIKPLALSRLVR